MVTGDRIGVVSSYCHRLGPRETLSLVHLFFIISHSQPWEMYYYGLFIGKNWTGTWDSCVLLSYLPLGKGVRDEESLGLSLRLKETETDRARMNPQIDLWDGVSPSFQNRPKP